MMDHRETLTKTRSSDAIELFCETKLAIREIKMVICNQTEDSSLHIHHRAAAVKTTLMAYFLSHSRYCSE